MTYRISGADRKTGKDRWAIIDEDSHEEAERQAQTLGILVSESTQIVPRCPLCGTDKMVWRATFSHGRLWNIVATLIGAAAMLALLLSLVGVWLGFATPGVAGGTLVSLSLGSAFGSVIVLMLAVISSEQRNVLACKGCGAAFRAM
jgi:hypothetical protein